MVTTEFTPYDSLIVNVDDKGRPISFNSDISLLKRTEVLNMLPNSVDSLFDSSSLSNPYVDMSDDDIIENTKSRRLQSPSELKQWSESLVNVANYKKAMYKKSRSNDSVSSDDINSVDSSK